MHTYLLLGNWTEQGAENLKKDRHPFELIKDVFEGMNLPLKAVYLVCGQYDVAAVCEAPDEKALAHALCALEQGASVRAATLRVCTPDEYHLRIRQWS